MTTTAIDDPPGPVQDRPYPPSWVDRVTQRVGSLPGPSWTYYLALFLLQLLYVHAVVWRHGRTPVGTGNIEASFFVFVVPYLLWVRSRLDRTASEALRAFRSALSVSDEAVGVLRYRLTTLPARDAWITTAVIALAAVWRVVSMPSSIVEQYASSHDAFVLEIGPLAIAALVTTAVCTHHALHQLRMVAEIHRLAIRLDLFQRQAVYAFSRLTARTGMSFLLAAYAVVALAPRDLLEHYFGGAMVLAVVASAIACFVLPLHGMHLRVTAEKDRLLAGVTARLEVVFARLHRRVDDDVVADAQQVQAQLLSLTAEREVLERISTWPWRAETMTTFATTLLLPSIVWLATQMLERFGL